jgi:hypothetical protein
VRRTTDSAVGAKIFEKAISESELSYTFHRSFTSVKPHSAQRNGSTFTAATLSLTR